MNIKYLFILIISIFFISIISANLPIYPKNLNPDTSYTFQINLTNNNNCSGVLLSSSETFTTDSGGIGFISLDISSLTVIPNRICIYNSTGLRNNESYSDLIFNSLRVNGNISASFYSGDGSKLTGISTYNATYDSKADYQFTEDFNGSNNFATTGNIQGDGLSAIRMILNDTFLNLDNWLNDSTKWNTENGTAVIKGAVTSIKIKNFVPEVGQEYRAKLDYISNGGNARINFGGVDSDLFSQGTNEFYIRTINSEGFNITLFAVPKRTHYYDNFTLERIGVVRGALEVASVKADLANISDLYVKNIHSYENGTSLGIEAIDNFGEFIQTWVPLSSLGNNYFTILGTVFYQMATGQDVTGNGFYNPAGDEGFNMLYTFSTGTFDISHFGIVDPLVNIQTNFKVGTPTASLTIDHDVAGETNFSTMNTKIVLSPDIKDVNVYADLNMNDDYAIEFGSGGDYRVEFNGTDMVDTGQVGSFNRYWNNLKGFVFGGNATFTQNVDIEGYLDVGGISNFTGNVTSDKNMIILQDNKFCFDGSTCARYITYNGTCLTNGTTCIG